MAIQTVEFEGHSGPIILNNPFKVDSVIVQLQQKVDKSRWVVMNTDIVITSREIQLNMGSHVDSIEMRLVIAG